MLDELDSLLIAVANGDRQVHEDFYRLMMLRERLRDTNLPQE